MNRHFFPRLSAVGLCCLLSSLFRPAAAQEKETVLIDRFDHTRDVPVPYVESLREQVGRSKLHGSEERYVKICIRA